MREIIRAFTVSIATVNGGGAVAETTGKALSLEIEEMALPLIRDVKDAFHGGGMPGPVNVPLGIQLSEARFKLTSVNRHVIGLTGKAPGQRDRVTMRGAAVSEVDGSTTPLMCVLDGRVSEPEPDRWQRGQRSGVDYLVDSIVYYKLVIGQQLTHEIDFLNFRQVVNGIDQLADVRGALAF